MKILSQLIMVIEAEIGTYPSSEILFFYFYFLFLNSEDSATAIEFTPISTIVNN